MPRRRKKRRIRTEHREKDDCAVPPSTGIEEVAHVRSPVVVIDAVDLQTWRLLDYREEGPSFPSVVPRVVTLGEAPAPRPRVQTVERFGLVAPEPADQDRRVVVVCPKLGQARYDSTASVRGQHCCGTVACTEQSTSR